MLVGVPCVTAADIRGGHEHNRGETVPLQDRRDRLRHVSISIVECDQHNMVARILKAIKGYGLKSAIGEISHLIFELPRADKEIPLNVVTTHWRLHDRVVHQRYAGRLLATSRRVSETNSTARRARSCKVKRCAISRRLTINSAVLN